MSLNTYSNSAISGGAERTMETLLRNFRAHGHTVAVMGTSREPGLHRFDDGDIPQWRAGIRNIYWPRPDESHSFLARRLWHLRDIYNVAMRAPLAKVLQTVRPDVVFVHNLPGWSIAAILTIRKCNIPVVQIVHDHYNVCVNTGMRRNEKNCMKQCYSCKVMRVPHRLMTQNINAVVGVSQYILDRHLALGAYNNVPIKKIIHNVRSAATLGVAENCRTPGPAEGAIRFGYIGGLHETKGIEYLLQNFAQWDDPQAELLVAGDGKPAYVARLQSIAGPRVKFLGRVTPKAFFPQVDVTIVPSLWQENFPGVVLESFAFGVPVIASRRGGIPEIVDDGVTGLIFEPDEAGALQRALACVTANRDLVNKMGNSVLAAGAKFLDVEQWYQSYLQLIEEVLGHG